MFLGLIFGGTPAGNMTVFRLYRRLEAKTKGNIIRNLGVYSVKE